MNQRNNLAILLLSLLPACLPADGADDDGGTPDRGIRTEGLGDGSYRTVVDARDEASWKHLDFESRAAVDAASPAWDLGFLRFNVATRVEVAVLAGADFDAIAAAPAGGYVEDAGRPDPEDMETMPGYAFDLWYEYDQATHVLSARDVVYVVRSAEGNYFKVQMQDYYDDAGTSGYVTLRWAPVAPPA